jgi:hypothetical protein
MAVQKTYLKVDANQSDDDDENAAVDLNGYIGHIRRDKEKLETISPE